LEEIAAPRDANFLGSKGDPKLPPNNYLGIAVGILAVEALHSPMPPWKSFMEEGTGRGWSGRYRAPAPALDQFARRDPLNAAGSVTTPIVLCRMARIAVVAMSVQL
jgi:hypothetical protein